VFTADPEIASDVADLFNFVTGFGRPQRFRKLLVAPFNLKKQLIERIRDVAIAAQAGKPSRIRLKCNNLTHPEVIEELYRASQAGVEIDIVVRAVCSLVPGVPGLSETIRVRSVLGRFLEHSRLYCFDAGEDRTYLLGSADLMPRNLDHRIEVVTPAEDPHVRAEIDAIFKALLNDNSGAWELHRDEAWQRVLPKKGERRRSAQAQFMRRRDRARRLTRPG
jgi:polyphosphate kinase